MTVQSKRIAEIARYQRKVSIWLRDPSTERGSTIYLSPHAAKQIGEQLIRYAEDCKAHDEFESGLGPWAMMQRI
jgi:hypothetical protein